VTRTTPHPPSTPGAGRSDAFDVSLPPVAWVDPDDHPSRLRVGWFCDNGLFRPSPAIRRAVREASETLGGGARVVPVQPPDAEQTTRLFLQLVGADRFRTSRTAARGEKLVPALKQNFMAASMPATLKRGQPRPQEHRPDPALPRGRHTDALDPARVLPATGRTAPVARRHDGRLGRSWDRRGHLPGVRAASSAAWHNQRSARGGPPTHSSRISSACPPGLSPSPGSNLTRKAIARTAVTRRTVSRNVSSKAAPGYRSQSR